MNFDHTKPFRTIRGWSARFMGILNHPDYPLVVAIMHPFLNTEELYIYSFDGKTHARYFHTNLEQENKNAIGTSYGFLTLENFDNPGLTTKDFVSVQVHEKPPMNLEESANPFHYDLSSIGTNLVRGWVAMYDGSDNRDDPKPLTRLGLVNTRTGQWLHLSFTQKQKLDDLEGG